MKVLLCFIIFVFFASNCKNSKVKPTGSYKSLNKEQDTSENGKVYTEKEVDIIGVEGKITPLYWAVFRNELQEAGRLLGLGADPNIGGDKACIPLLTAVSNKNKEMVSLLLSYGAKIIFDKDGRSSALEYVRYKKR